MAEESIETTFASAISTGKINGAILCATNASGDSIYSKQLGNRTLISGEKQPHQPNDVLFLASATKLLATISALQCVEDGLLSLTGDLSSLAPELAAKQILTGFSADGTTPILEPQTRPITLEMLLTHSSGLVYHFMNPLIAQWRSAFALPASDASGDKTVEELFSYPLSFQPGSGWMYSPGLDWAGRIVERATGQTLGEHMAQRIFSPLGITDAQFYPVTRAELRERMVDLNPADRDGRGRAVVGGSEDVNRSTKGDFGGHGLFMTAPDYLKVLRSLLANDGTLLKSDTVEAMFENHLSPNAAAGHRVALDGPGGVFFRVGVAPDAEAGFGLGGLLSLGDVEGWYGERTLSWGGGHTFAWFIDRKNDLCAVGALQAAMPTDVPAVTALKDVFRHDIYRKHAAWKKDRTS